MWLSSDVSSSVCFVSLIGKATDTAVRHSLHLQMLQLLKFLRHMCLRPLGLWTFLLVA